MAALAGTTLIRPGTPLDILWRTNPEAHARLVPLGASAGAGLLLLSGLLALSGIGWMRRRLWGWQLSMGVLAAQLVGGVLSLADGEWLKGTFGVMAAAALMYGLRRPVMRAAFGRVGA